LLGRLRRGYVDLLDEHRRLLRMAFNAHDGAEVRTEGDSFFVVFARAGDAVAAAVAGQRALASGRWPEECDVRVRMGIHTGEAVLREGDYTGLDVHRAARISAASHGGQILVSSATRELVAGELAGDVALWDLGAHWLKDLDRPERLYQVVIDGLRSDFPPLPSPRAIPQPASRLGLPVPATSFLGRARELAEVTALLRSGDTRLLTLTGAGGSGKTRLALRVAEAVRTDYGDGSWFVGFGDITDPELITLTICEALGLTEPPGLAPVARLEQWLGDRAVLLVLDNLEQLAEGAIVLGQVLAACPGLALLVTSREPLRLVGERQYDVPVLAHVDAIELFIARSRAVAPQLAVDPALAGMICERLDCLPLAIELAAARVKALSPGQILARLDRVLPLLSGGPRDAPQRQRTLKATIDWSYELLSEQERRLFARLAVFAGGCTLAAAQAVCQAHLDTLQALVDRSLVRRDGERYWMLQTLREYALERLEQTGEENDLRRRHHEWFAELVDAEALDVHDLDPENIVRGAHSSALDQERENIKSALEWALKHRGWRGWKRG
jgi:predicted ATPase